jgi:hypothetical protein
MTSSPIPHVERPAFFDGQRLTADDLTAAASYARSMRQLHNRALHGWGVVAGLGVSGARGERFVRLDGGFALDCAGRELLLTSAQELAVPPVAAEGHWFLAVSAVPEDELPAEKRAGTCETEGAVRLLDAPLVRWLSASGKNGARLRPGLDVVLAAATVANCRLARDLDLDARQELAPEQPYVAAGATAPSGTAWRRWPASGKQHGVMTEVSTAEAGFRSTPSYQARVAGSRQKGNLVIDGPAHVEHASATSFDFCVDLRQAGEQAIKAADPQTLRNAGWHVVWMGVETQ